MRLHLSAREVDLEKMAFELKGEPKVSSHGRDISSYGQVGVYVRCAVCHYSGGTLIKWDKEYFHTWCLRR